MTYETGEWAVMLHSLNRCNLDCYGCFNKPVLTDVPEKEVYTVEQTLLNLSLAPKVSTIILSGSEFLENSLIEIVPFITDLSKRYKKIIIYTNGTMAFKIHALNLMYLLPAIIEYHVDIKFPYWLPHTEETAVAEKVLGVPYSKKLRNAFMNMCILMEKEPHRYKARTVKYPFYSKEVLDAIEDKMKQIGVTWSANEFIEQ
jgi:organic radical activating enzyme